LDQAVGLPNHRKPKSNCGIYNNSSVAVSNWNGRAVWDPNVPVAHRGDGEVRNRFQVNVTKKLDVFSFGSTYVTLAYNGKNGLPYSIVAYNDVNGDGQYNDLMYIPRESETGVGNFTAGGTTLSLPWTC